MNSDNNNLLDKSDEEDEDENDDEVPAPNPAAAPDVVDWDDNVDGDDVGNDDVSTDPEIPANEEKITKAAKHVTMAHAARVLFLSFVTQANADCAFEDT
jgi:hypothetical protein